jgi:hypothetical protein
LSRDAFVSDLGRRVSNGASLLLTAPLGAGKTHVLAEVRRRLERDRPVAFVDLFTAASTPEHLLSTLAGVVAPFMAPQRDAIAALVAETVDDRHRASGALLRFFELLRHEGASTPFVWLIDEATEIRSLAYFPELAEIEKPFLRGLLSSHAVLATSSYPALAEELFPDIEAATLPGLAAADIETSATFQSERRAIADAIALTSGIAATLLPMLARIHETRDAAGSLAVLLRPGAPLELVCRRHYEVMLLRSRGYAVSKRAAETVAGGAAQRLTDLFPLIGRTAGASRQYLRWLVEVGLLTQIRKRYDFADPVLGLWASLYLGRADHPSDADIAKAVADRLEKATAIHGPDTAVTAPDDDEAADSEPSAPAPKRRVDRFEEID